MRTKGLPALVPLAALAWALSGCNSSPPSQAAGSTTAPVDSGPLPLSLAFWDERHGLLGARTCWDCRGGTISTTDDGGRTWHVQRRTARRVSWVTTLGDRQAWAIAGRNLLHSVDGGQSWRLVSRSRLLSAGFTGESVGWGVLESPQAAFESMLVRTADGGRTWQPSPVPCPRVVGGVMGVSFPTPTTGWLLCVGEPGAGQQQKAVLATIDGGRSWQAVSGAIVGNTSLGGGLGGYGYPLGIAFRPDGRGLLWEGRGTLFVTHDGGRTWTPKDKVVGPEVDFGQSASLPRDRVFFVLLQRGSFRLLRSQDGGRTWSVIHRWLRPKS